MWRAYRRRGPTFSIGIEAGAVKGTGSWRIGPVIYRTEEQEALIRAALSLWKPLFEQDPSIPSDAQAVSERLGQLLGALQSDAIFLKHPDFEEEVEWRFTYLLPPPDLTAQVDPAAILPVSHRPSHLGPTPYVEVPLISDQNAHPIREVWVGPNAHQPVVLESLHDYLRSQGLDETITVCASPTPFREPG
jgi:hypothetical protein